MNYTHIGVTYFTESIFSLDDKKVIFLSSSLNRPACKEIRVYPFWRETVGRRELLLEIPGFPWGFSVYLYTISEIRSPSIHKKFGNATFTWCIREGRTFLELHTYILKSSCLNLSTSMNN